MNKSDFKRSRGEFLEVEDDDDLESVLSLQPEKLEIKSINL